MKITKEDIVRFLKYNAETLVLSNDKEEKGFLEKDFNNLAEKMINKLIYPPG